MEDGGLHDGQGDNIRILINLSGVCGTSIRISTSTAVCTLYRHRGL